MFKKILHITKNIKICLYCDRKDEISTFMTVGESKILATNIDDLCKQVFDLDSHVRFAGIANSKGMLVAGGQRDNVESMFC